MKKWIIPKKFYLYYHTLKYIKLKQAFYRIVYYVIKHHFFRMKIPKEILLNNQGNKGIFLKNDKIFFRENKACFINQFVDVMQSTIWNDPCFDKLWLYQLHYFDALNANDADQQKQAYKFLKRWINENSPVKGVAWDPYPTSLRIMNIIKYALSGNDLSEEITQSLYSQANYLNYYCEYHLLGNHLFENFRALCFAGLYFDTPVSRRWFRKGYSGLKKEIKEQVLEDGGHFELSPMYHCIILGGLLDLHQLFKVYQSNHFFLWEDVVEKMLNWLSYMQRSQHEISYFNDASNEMSASPRQLFSYAKLLGYPNFSENVDLKHLDQSGYVVLRNQNIKTILDVGAIGPEYLPAHAHADTLSFELYIDELPVFINLGTSCYGLSERRQFERSTKAHNTVTVNHENSSEVWHGFRVAKRALVRNIKIDNRQDIKIISAAHNGYERFDKNLIHHRCWSLSTKELIVSDSVSSNFSTAYAYFHLHPDCEVVEKSIQKISITLSNNKMITCESDNQLELIENQYAVSFGQLKKTKTICVILDKKNRTGQFKVNFTVDVMQ